MQSDAAQNGHGYLLRCHAARDERHAKGCATSNFGDEVITLLIAGLKRGDSASYVDLLAAPEVERQRHGELNGARVRRHG